MSLGERKAIFITGAASGIGLACAERFAREGWFVGLADIDEPGLARALGAIGADNGSAHPLDVRQREAWTPALRAFVDKAGRLDVLFNNAGVARFGPFETVDPEGEELMLAVNVRGVLAGARAALPFLKATPGSRLINMASCAGIYGSPGLAAYSATKFAVRGLSEALDAEWAAHGVAVACIMPWFVETPILRNSQPGRNADMGDELRKSGLPVYGVEEASDTVWRAANGRELYYIVGQKARQMRLMARLAPGVLRNRLRSRPRPA